MPLSESAVAELFINYLIRFGRRLRLGLGLRLRLLGLVRGRSRFRRKLWLLGLWRGLLPSRSDARTRAHETWSSGTLADTALHPGQYLRHHARLRAQAFPLVVMSLAVRKTAYGFLIAAACHPGNKPRADAGRLLGLLDASLLLLFRGRGRSARLLRRRTLLSGFPGRRPQRGWALGCGALRSRTLERRGPKPADSCLGRHVHGLRIDQRPLGGGMNEPPLAALGHRIFVLVAQKSNTIRLLHQLVNGAGIALELLAKHEDCLGVFIQAELQLFLALALGLHVDARQCGGQRNQQDRHYHHQNQQRVTLRDSEPEGLPSPEPRASSPESRGPSPESGALGVLTL